MINTILNLLYKYKAINIKIIKNSNLYAKYIILATGTSQKHINSLANEFMKNYKKKILTLSGQNTNWIIIDINYVVIHIMLENTRSYYNLESLYSTIINND